MEQRIWVYPAAAGGKLSRNLFRRSSSYPGFTRSRRPPETERSHSPVDDCRERYRQTDVVRDEQAEHLVANEAAERVRPFQTRMRLDVRMLFELPNQNVRLLPATRTR